MDPNGMHGVGMILSIVVMSVGCNTLNDLQKIPSLASLQHEDVVHSSASESIHTLQRGEDLQSLIESAPGPVLIDFYADWCGPCRKQAQVLHDMDAYLSDIGAQVIKVNTETHARLSRKYGVRGLPTLVVVRDGEIVTEKTGLTNRKSLESMLR